MHPTPDPRASPASPTPAAPASQPPPPPAQAADGLAATLYHDLRRLAASLLRSERVSHTLQPTALVHEAYLRLAHQHQQFSDRTRFIAHASSMMRRILVDHARARLADKRGGGRTHIPLGDELGARDGVGRGRGIEAAAIEPSAQHAAPIDLLALDAALQRLAQIEPDQARIVELRFFGGLNVDETAAVMNIGKRSVDREWACARAWLFRELGGGSGGSGGGA